MTRIVQTRLGPIDLDDDIRDEYKVHVGYEEFTTGSTDKAEAISIARKRLRELGLNECVIWRRGFSESKKVFLEGDATE